MQRLAFALLMTALVTACGGGGGGNVAPAPATPTNPPTTAPTPAPTPTYPASSAASVSAGAAAQSATFPAVGTGVSAAIMVPATSSGTASVALALSATLPAGTPAVASVKRIPATIGVTILSSLAYLSFTPSATIVTPTSPAFVFTLAPGSSLPAGASSYVAFYDPAAGSWVNLDGPGVAGSAGAFTFAANPVPMTFKAGVTYLFGWYATAAVVAPLATPSPSPSPTVTPSTAPTGATGPGTPLSGPTYNPLGAIPQNQSWGPNDVAGMLQYPVQSGFDGTGITVAIIGDSNVGTSDLLQYFTTYRTPSTGRQISYVPVDNATATGTASSEVALDVETVGGLAPGANITVYIVPSLTTTEFNNAYNQIVAQHTAHVVSISASACESSGTNGSSAILKAGAAEGIAFVAAAGDQGNECYNGTVNGTDSFKPGVGYPASDPSVIGVGGNETGTLNGPTSLLAPVAWNDVLTADHTQEATGGGISSVFGIPAYQSGLAGLASTTARNVPDVAMPAVDASVYVGGTWKLVNGTSWGTPLFAALLAQTYQYCNVTGIASPAALPYTAYARGGTSVFADVTSGNNQYGGTTPFFSAGPGYDNATGLGVPFGLPFAQALCPHRTPAGLARSMLVPASTRRAVQAYQTDLAPHVAGLIDNGRRSASATTAVQVVIEPGPSAAADETSAIGVLQGAGLTITRTFTNHLVVDASGPAANVERLFTTQLHDVSQGRYGMRYTPVGSATIPAELAPYAAAVVLDDVVVARMHP